MTSVSWVGVSAAGGRRIEGAVERLAKELGQKRPTADRRLIE
jgi:hypothetical protein